MFTIVNRQSLVIGTNTGFLLKILDYGQRPGICSRIVASGIFFFVYWQGGLRAPASAIIRVRLSEAGDIKPRVPRCSAVRGYIPAHFFPENVIRVVLFRR